MKRNILPSGVTSLCGRSGDPGPHIPKGIELDSWNCTTFVSLVAFSFLKTRVKGVPIPCIVISKR